MSKLFLTQDEVNKTIEELRATMKGLGTDDKKLLNILGSKTPKQMAQIMSRYHNNYGRTLYQHISGEVHGSFGSICKGVALPIIEFDCDLLHKACDKTFTANYTYITEVLVGRTNHDINAIKTCYEEKYHEKVEDLIKRKCFGDMERLYLTCLKANREETKEYTEEDITEDVNTLYQATECKWNASEKVVTDILCRRQFQHLRNVFFAYQNKHHKPFTFVVESKFIGPIKKNFIILIKSAMNRYQYIAEQFNIAINSTSVQHTKLIRYTIRYRTPIILDTIKEIYNSNYSKTFGEDLNNAMFVDDRTKDMLLLLLNEKKIKKKSKKSEENGEVKSRGIPDDAFDTDSEEEEDDGFVSAKLLNKEDVIDDIEIVSDNGNIEVKVDDDKKVQQTKEE